MSSTFSKNNALEGLRGLASLIVVVSHCVSAFFPQIAGDDPALAPDANLKGTLGYFLINREAAAVFFFVLSGYVLALRSLETNDAFCLLPSAIKRLPRFAVPVFFTVMGSWLLLVLGAYPFYSAGASAHSYWLQSFGNGGCASINPLALGAATSEGFYQTFLAGAHCYDSSLRTMPIALYGSFPAYLTACLLVVWRQHIPRLVAGIALILIASLLCANYYVAFPAGALLAFWTIHRPFPLNRLEGMLALLIALFLLGYVEQGPIYSPLSSLFPKPYFAYILAAGLLIYVVENNSRIHDFFGHSLFRKLGRLSFAVYLLHLLVLFSLGSWIYLGMSPLRSPIIAGIFASFFTMLGTFGAAYGFTYFDQRWANWLRAMINPTTVRQWLKRFRR